MCTLLLGKANSCQYFTSLNENERQFACVVQVRGRWNLTVKLYFSLLCPPGWVEKETYYWSTEPPARAPYIFHLFLPFRHLLPGKTHLQMSRPLKDKNSFEAIFITTAPKIKNSKSTFTTFYIDPPLRLPPPSPMILFACVLSHCCVHKPVYLPNGSCILCM